MNVWFPEEPWERPAYPGHFILEARVDEDGGSRLFHLEHKKGNANWIMVVRVPQPHGTIKRLLVGADLAEAKKRSVERFMKLVKA